MKYCVRLWRKDIFIKSELSEEISPTFMTVMNINTSGRRIQLPDDTELRAGSYSGD